MTDLIALTSAFLTATGLFFTALGAAETHNEPLKVFLSASALLMSVIWYQSAALVVSQTIDANMIFWLTVVLPVSFIAGWSGSLAVHSYRLFKELKASRNVSLPTV